MTTSTPISSSFQHLSAKTLLLSVRDHKIHITTNNGEEKEYPVPATSKNNEHAQTEEHPHVGSTAVAADCQSQPMLINSSFCASH
jgi:hypothetical protein